MGEVFVDVNNKILHALSLSLCLSRLKEVMDIYLEGKKRRVLLDTIESVRNGLLVVGN
jgi:hypothetical protein